MIEKSFTGPLPPADDLYALFEIFLCLGVLAEHHISLLRVRYTLELSLTSCRERARSSQYDVTHP